jgi:glutamate N-acetyltransferase/amino-acid N-acetyltransferase
MIHSVEGLRLGVAQAGIKLTDHDDVVLMSLASGTSTAVVFTQNAFRAAPGPDRCGAQQVEPRAMLTGC